MSNVIRKMCRRGGGRGKVGSSLTLNQIILVQITSDSVLMQCTVMIGSSLKFLLK